MPLKTHVDRKKSVTGKRKKMRRITPKMRPIKKVRGEFPAFLGPPVTLKVAVSPEGQIELFRGTKPPPTYLFMQEMLMARGTYMGTIREALQIAWNLRRLFDNR